MIGIFDSGMGGAYSLFELRRLCPNASACFFADRENLPYGEKTREELISLVCSDIDVLREMGADSVLMACCSASSVYELLPENYKMNTYPIIEPSVKEALMLSRCARIGVISTEATKRSGEFARIAKEIEPNAEVINISAGELVSLAERGQRDGKLSGRGKEIIRKSLLPFRDSGIDTLILGCTHFSYFEREIENIIGAPTVNCASVGARRMAELLSL